MPVKEKIAALIDNGRIPEGFRRTSVWIVNYLAVGRYACIFAEKKSHWY